MNIEKTIEEIDNLIYLETKKINNDNYNEILEKVYCYVKSKLNDLYNGKYLHPEYSIIRNSLMMMEDNIKGKLINTNSYFNINNKPEDLIEYLVYEARRYLINKYYSYYLKKENILIDELNLTNYCEDSANYIKTICDRKKIKCFIIPIYPGYTDKINLYNGTGFHFANIVYYNNNYYLIDITYSQFFYKNRNNLERIGLIDISNCKPGLFMLNNNQNKKLAIELLEKGYIKLDEDKLKRYLDAFTISFRNGLYYESTDDFSYTTSYTIYDYVNFLKGYDNQINHEGIDNLGYQKRPMKKYISMKKN